MLMLLDQGPCFGGPSLVSGMAWRGSSVAPGSLPFTQGLATPGGRRLLLSNSSSRVPNQLPLSRSPVSSLRDQRGSSLGQIGPAVGSDPSKSHSLRRIRKQWFSEGKPVSFEGHCCWKDESNCYSFHIKINHA